MNEDFEKGYYAAIDDVQEAMKRAEVNTMGPAGFLSYNDPVKFVAELQMLKAERFETWKRS